MEATAPLAPLPTSGPELPAAPYSAVSKTLPPQSAVSLPPHGMNRDFIDRNQVVERYLSGKLPIKGATDFERFCHDHPEMLDELGLPERVNAGLRLLEAAGKPEPWQEAPKKFWEKPFFGLAFACATFVLLIGLAVVASNGSAQTRKIAALQKQLGEQPLEPATSTRTIHLLPSRQSESDTAAVIIGGGPTQLADLKIDMSRSPFRIFRVTIDRVNQGRVMVLNNLMKDSNGHVRIALNSSALGPGNYKFTIEGLTWRGETVPDAWVTIGVAR